MRDGRIVSQEPGGPTARGCDLVRESMSASGVETARNVMRLNDYVRKLTGRTEEYDEWYYWMSIMGSPSQSVWVSRIRGDAEEGKTVNAGAVAGRGDFIVPRAW